MFEKLKNKDIHDPAWLKRQEEQLRAHIRSTPAAPSPSKLPALALVAVIILLGVVLLLPDTQKSVPSPTPTQTPIVTTIIPTPTPAPSQTPTQTPTPTPTSPTSSGETRIP